VRASLLLSAAILATVAVGVGVESTQPTPAPSPLVQEMMRTVSCHAPATVDRRSISIQVVTASSAKFAFAGVCLGSSGPFPFMIDTGTTRTVIATATARSIGLEGAGTGPNFEPLGCAPTRPQTAHVTSWSLGGIELRPQVVLTMPIATFIPGIQLAGIIGADVLARFGAIRLDYSSQVLAVESPEGPPLANGKMKPWAGTLPKFDTAIPGALVPRVTTETLANAVVALVPVDTPHGSFYFIIDSGSQLVLADTALARATKLQETSEGMLSPMNCSRRVNVYSAPADWYLFLLQMKLREVGELPLSTPVALGDLGEPVLAEHRGFTLDFTRGLLVILGAHEHF
jgi:hypothetical protein